MKPEDERELLQYERRALVKERADWRAEQMRLHTMLAGLRAVLREARPFADRSPMLAKAIAGADVLDYETAEESAVLEVRLNGDKVLARSWSVEGGWVDVALQPFRVVGGLVLTERFFGEIEVTRAEDA